MLHLLSEILFLSYFENVVEINPPSAYVQTDRSPLSCWKGPRQQLWRSDVKCSVKQGPLAFDDWFPWSIKICFSVLPVLQLSEMRNLESPMVIWHCQNWPQPWNSPGCLQISFHWDGNGFSFIHTIQVSTTYSCQPVHVLGGMQLQDLPPPAEGVTPHCAAFIPLGFGGCRSALLCALNRPCGSAASQRGISSLAGFSRSWCII